MTTDVLLDVQRPLEGVGEVRLRPVRVRLLRCGDEALECAVQLLPHREGGIVCFA
jgi:hypothetical protein